jgi:signal transduction histidine kinase
MKWQYKFTLISSLTTITGMALAIISLRAFHKDIDQNLPLLFVLATLFSMFTGTIMVRPLAHRLKRALDISQTWMRGQLSLHIRDTQQDELGLLASQMDVLAEQLQQDEQDLTELRQRNVRLTHQVRALAVVEERNRLVRELHDSVKQYLFSLAMTASAIRTRFKEMDEVSDELVEMIIEVETSAKTAQRETTRLIEDLRPGSLQERGLVETLNDYTLLFGAQENLLIYLDTKGDLTRLPP